MKASSLIDHIIRELKGKYGIYLLFISLAKKAMLKIGSLGEISFDQGFYIYIGSALGLGGLEKRLVRYLYTSKKKFWHIDYFLDSKSTEITSIGVHFAENKCECLIRNVLLDFSNIYSSMEIYNFGSSDCKCKSHLFYFSEKIASKNLVQFFAKKGYKLIIL